MMTKWALLLLVVGCVRCASEPPPKAAEVPEATRLFQMGEQLAAAGESVRAEHYLNAAMNAGYPKQEVLPRLLEVCVDGSRLRAAVNYAERYLEEQPDDARLRTLVASLYLGLGQSEHAYEQLSFALHVDPESRQTHYLMGITAWEHFHDAAGAREHFLEYLRLAPHGKRSRQVRLWLERHPSAGAQPSAQLEAPAPLSTPQRVDSPDVANVSPIPSAPAVGKLVDGRDAS